jgi:hypothetical protein
MMFRLTILKISVLADPVVSVPRRSQSDVTATALRENRAETLFLVHRLCKSHFGYLHHPGLLSTQSAAYMRKPC